MKYIKYILLMLTLILVSCGDDSVEQGVSNDLDKAVKVEENKVQYKQQELKEADGETFTTLNNYYSKDKNNIYYVGMFDDKMKKFEKISTGSFEIIDWCYVKDENGVYCLWVEWKDIDKENLEVLNDFYAKDSESIYFLAKKIENIDMESLEVLNRYFIKDKNWIYYWGKKLENIDLETAEVVKWMYVKDKDNVYCSLVPIQWADVETFEVLQDIDDSRMTETTYLKDKNSVYVGSKMCIVKKIEWANPETFKIINGEYSQDDKNCYKWEEVVEQAECKNESK